jgi:hypothetical protein
MVLNALTSGESLKIVVALEDLASAGLKKIDANVAMMGKTATTASGSKAGGGVGGLGGALSGLINPATIAISGMAAFGSILGSSLKASNDNSDSINQLSTALKSNVSGWNGNMSAIESYISSAEAASEFNKNDLRTSLQSLIAATHNVSKAEQDQAIATNLARFNNEDLQAATTTLVNVEAGRYRALAQLGINIKNVHSSTEALYDIQQRVAGQDQTYLDSYAGKLQHINNVLTDAKVSFGDWAKEQAAAAITELGVVGDWIRTHPAPIFGTDDSGAQQRASDRVHTWLANILVATEQAQLAYTSLAGKQADDLDSMSVASQDFIDKNEKIWGPGGSFTTAVGDTLATMGSFPSIAAQDLNKGQGDISAAAKNLADALADPLSTGQRITDLKNELAGKGKKGSIGQELAAGLRSSDPLVVAAAKQLQADLEAQLTGLEADYQVKFIQDRGKDNPGGQYVSSNAPRHAPTASNTGAKKAGNSGTPAKTTTNGAKKLASGGFWDAGEWSWVGENGPELRYSARPSHVFTNPQSMAMTGSDNRPRLIQIALDGKVLAEVLEPYLDRINGKKHLLMGTSGLGY